MVPGGYRRKPETYKFLLTNIEILHKCSTENLIQFINRLQRNYTAHVIRGEDTRISKRLLFNDDKRRKTGHQITLYNSVVANENITPDVFNKNSLLRKY